MSFFTAKFFGCFAVAFLCWWAWPNRWRRPFLALLNLAFALLFGARVAVLLLVLTAVGWLAGQQLAAHRAKGRLFGWVTICLLPLLAYKYLPVLWPEVSGLLAPLGLSFYTFKTISYLIEIHRGRQLPVRSFVDYFCYIGFFPQLPMGPIQRPQPFFDRLNRLPAKLDTVLAWSGCTRLCWAMFLKKCIADPMVTYQAALVSPERYYPLSMVWSLVAYSLYLYFDFAAYSQLAIGLGELLGLPCKENFRSPYFATSLGDFWHRWHISLSGFLQEYVYFPLGGSRNGVPKLILATMATFLLSGVWHGATGGFLIWGALHGMCLLLGRATKKMRDGFWRVWPAAVGGPVRSVCGWALTMLLVGVGWLFFYAETLPAALSILQEMFAPAAFSLQYVKESITLLGLTPKVLTVRGGLLAIAAAVDFASRKEGFGSWMSRLPVWVRVALCYVFVFGCLFWGEASSLPGVYFQF